jgi:4-amino-4-deoxy-L-arabinose transferase-like glycosyltransferase
MTTEALFKRNISIIHIVLLCVLLWGGEYVRRDLWEPDEARYALVSKEMREGGHWLVPFRQGEFYSHKPPLMFWLTNAFSLINISDVGTVAPRMPSFIGAIMALWAASRIASMWFSKRAGWLTVLILSSSFLFWNKGGFGQIDMLLCGLEMMALYLLFSTSQQGGNGRILLAYIFMGLGVLAKGPVGFIVPVGVYISATINSREQKPVVSGWHWLWGPLVALSLPGIWLLLAWWQGAPDGYFNELLLKQNVGRVSGEFGGHNQPFYYFLKYLPIDFLPWSVMIPLSVVALSRVPDCRISRRRLISWIAFVVIFFSLSATKRNLYILLVYPAAAILVAGATDHWPAAGERWLKRTFWVQWSLLLLMGIAMTVASFMTNLPINSLMLLPGGFIMLAGCWWTYDTHRSNPWAVSWLCTMATTVLITFASIGVLVYPEFDDLKTPDELIAVARDNLAKDDRIIMYMQHGEIFSLYTGHMGYMAFSPDEVKNFIKSSSQKKHMIIVLQEHVPEVMAIVGSSAAFHQFKMGSKSLAWVYVDASTLSVP